MGYERVANANGAVRPLPFVSKSLVSENGRLFLCVIVRQALIYLDNLSQLVTLSYSPVSILLTPSEFILFVHCLDSTAFFGFYEVPIESRTLRVETEPQP